MRVSSRFDEGALSSPRCGLLSMEVTEYHGAPLSARCAGGLKSESRTMSIKSDKWIRRMATGHGMIEPFEAGQVRYRDDARIISYGTSSYGYDVRCSREFKIFTNVHSATADPKQIGRAS